MASVAVAVKQNSCFRSKSRVLLERCQRVDAGWSVVTLSTPETCGVFPARDVLCWSSVRVSGFSMCRAGGLWLEHLHGLCAVCFRSWQS